MGQHFCNVCWRGDTSKKGTIFAAGNGLYSPIVDHGESWNHQTLNGALNVFTPCMVAVENIVNNVHTKDNIWAVNMEEEYHEKKH